MKNKKYISKTIAMVLCVITITIATSTYLYYKDLYISNNNSPINSIIYTALAKTPLTDSNISIKSSDTALIPASEINKEAQQKKIVINILILFLSFISLASVHNLILNTREDNEFNSGKVDTKMDKSKI